MHWTYVAWEVRNVLPDLKGKDDVTIVIFLEQPVVCCCKTNPYCPAVPSRVVAAVRPGTTGSEEAVWLQLIIIRGGKKYKLPSFSFFLHWRCSFCHSAVERKDFWSQANEEVVCVGLIRQQMIHTAAGKICECQLELDKVKVNLVDSWNIKISL